MRGVELCLTLKERKSVVIETASRYQKAIKKQKKVILDEFVHLTGLTRNHASSLLRNHGKKVRKHGTLYVGDVRKVRKHKRPPTYTGQIKNQLIKVWEISGQLCGKRLKPLILENLESIQAHLCLDSQETSLLGKMSPATIDRLLRDEKRKRSLKRGISRTKPGSLLKSQIPIRTFADWNEDLPGFFEIDLVSHDGGNAKGDFCYTLTATDICTGWTILRAIQNRAQVWTVAALDEIRKSLPFKMQGLDSDNGSEFINAHLTNFCDVNKVTFTRSRPYRKNDNCFVEQKNYTIARKHVGYFRYEEKALQTMNQLFTQLAFFVNYFQPTMKLIKKERVGSKIKKIYDKPQTPFQRLISNPHVPKDFKMRAQAVKESVDLFELSRKVKMLSKRLLKLAERQ